MTSNMMPGTTWQDIPGADAEDWYCPECEEYKNDLLVRGQMQEDRNHRGECPDCGEELII